MDVVCTAEVPGKIVERVVDLAIGEFRPFTHRRLIRNSSDAKSHGLARNDRGDRADGEITVALCHLGEGISGARLADGKRTATTASSACRAVASMPI